MDTSHRGFAHFPDYFIGYFPIIGAMDEFERRMRYYMTEKLLLPDHPLKDGGDISSSVKRNSRAIRRDLTVIVHFFAILFVIQPLLFSLSEGVWNKKVIVHE